MLILVALVVLLHLQQANGQSRKQVQDWLHETTDELLQFRLLPKYRNKVFLIDGKITDALTDSIVNPVSKYCLGGAGGIDTIVHEAVGRSLTGKGLFRQEIINQLPSLSENRVRCPIGTAKAVRVPWNKQALGRTLSPSIRWIIQASGPQDGNLAALESCYWQIFEEAERVGARQVAVPSISTTEVGGIRWQVAADMAVSTAKLWINRNTDSDLQIVFYVKADEIKKAYIRAMRKYL